MRSKADRLLTKSGHMVGRGHADEWQKTLPPTARRRLARKMADMSKRAADKGDRKAE